MDDKYQTQEVAVSLSDVVDASPQPEPAPVPDVLSWLVERVDSLENHVEMLENRLSHLEMKNRF